MPPVIKVGETASGQAATAHSSTILLIINEGWSPGSVTQPADNTANNKQLGDTTGDHRGHATCLGVAAGDQHLNRHTAHFSDTTLDAQGDNPPAPGYKW